VLIVTHGASGGAMLDAARALAAAGGGTAPGDDFASLAIDVGEARDSARTRLLEAIDRLDGGDGVVIAVDLHGSTPHNLASEVARDVAARGGRVAVVSGVNLPMIVKLASVDRDRAPDELARVGVETAQRSIRVWT
jgi:PTS system mannose-specific IIA component